MDHLDGEIRGCTSRSELIAVVDLLDRAFENTSREYFERHVFGDPTLKPEHTRIYLKNGRVLSSVQIFPRCMCVGNASVPFGGLGNVATDPTERGRGLAACLMLDAVEWMKNAGFAFSMLSTTIPKYYERFGYRTVHREAILIDTMEMMEDPLVRVTDIRSDLDQIKNIYTLYNREVTGSLIRDDVYWDGQLRFSGEDHANFLVREIPGQIQGYLRSKVKKGELLILEFGAIGNYQENFNLLLTSLAARNPVRPVRVVISESEKKRILLKFHSRIVPDDELMVSVFDVEKNKVLSEQLLKPNNLTFWMSDFF